MANEVIINTIVNKNLIIVQYVDDTIDYENWRQSYEWAEEYPIICKTRVSTNFGQTWRELPLDHNGRKVKDYMPGYALNEYIFGLNNHNKLGKYGAQIEFVIRRGDGSRFYTYTPIYYRVVQGYGDPVISSTPCVTTLAWLVHNERGELISGADWQPLKSFIQPNSISEFTDLSSIGVEFAVYDSRDPLGSISSGVNFSDGSLSAEAGQYLANPFLALPFLPHLCSHTALNPESTKLLNQTDTVDYVHDGKRYTIIKKYYTTLFKRGNIYESKRERGDAVSGVSYDEFRISTDFYSVILPFIYVYDHSKIGTNDHTLKWIDVFNLETKCATAKNSIRGSKRYEKFIRSFISEDPNFSDSILGPSNTVFNYNAVGTDLDDTNYVNLERSAAPSCIVWDSAPHGALLKVTDKSTSKEMVGLIYGNKRLVCTGDPTNKSNWINGVVVPGHEHPTIKEAFYFKKVYPGRLEDLSNEPDSDFVTVQAYNGGGDTIDVNYYYTYFDVFGYRHPTLYVDVAGDRVPAIPFINASGDIEYRFCCFIKDTISGNITIGFKSTPLNVGYKALMDSDFFVTDTQKLPVAVDHITGAMFDTSQFVIRGDVGAYLDPYESESNTRPTSIGNGVYNQPYDPADYSLVATECVGFNLVETMRHNVNGFEKRVLVETESSTCGYTSGGAQIPKAINLVISKDIVHKFGTYLGYDTWVYGVGAILIRLDAVMSGDGRLIIRSKTSNFYSPSMPLYDKLGFVVASGNLEITFIKPEYYGLNQDNATHSIAINGTTVIPMDKNYVASTENVYIATAPATAYEGINCRNGINDLDYFKILSLTATKYGGNFIFGSNDTDQYPGLAEYLASKGHKLVLQVGDTIIEPVSGTTTHFTMNSVNSAEFVNVLKI